MRYDNSDRESSNVEYACHKTGWAPVLGTYTQDILSKTPCETTSGSLGQQFQKLENFITDLIRPLSKVAKTPPREDGKPEAEAKPKADKGPQKELDLPKTEPEVGQRTLQKMIDDKIAADIVRQILLDEMDKGRTQTRPAQSHDPSAQAERKPVQPPKFLEFNNPY
jgi:hypothetical protein